MNKQSKIVVIGGVIAMGVASNAFAVVACSGTAGNGTSVTGATTNFIRDGFTPKCSANVTVNFVQGADRVDVRGGSSKGMHTFGGSSEGGGIVQCESSSVATPSANASVTAGSGGCS